MNRSLATLAFVVAALSARAEDTPENAAARASWENLARARKDAEIMTAEVGKRAEKETDKEKKSRMLNEAWKRAARMMQPLEDSFRVAFDAGDRSKWDPAADAALLEAGLTQSAQHAYKTDPAAAVKSWEFLLEKLPNCPSARIVRGTWLPLGYPALGDPELALKKLTALGDSSPPEAKPDILMAMGDVKAMTRDFEGAQALYAEALKLIPATADPMKDARARAKGGLEMRQALIGKPAPEVDSKTWIGAEAMPLSKMKGSVVLLDFWATWCGPCIESIPGIEEIGKEFGEKGLKVLGITKFYDHGFIPANRGELAHNFKEGEPAQGLTKETFITHLQTFRERMEVAYPTVVADTPEFKAYKITGIPSLFVVDKEGLISFVAVGGMREPLLRAAVKAAIEAGK